MDNETGKRLGIIEGKVDTLLLLTTNRLDKLEIKVSKIENKQSWMIGLATGIGAESLTGFITIKDSGGTSRKIAVVS